MLIIALSQKGGLAQLARALAWHANYKCPQCPFNPIFLPSETFLRAFYVQPNLIKHLLITQI